MCASVYLTTLTTRKELIPLIRRRRLEEQSLHSDNKKEVENLNYSSNTFDALIVVDRSTDLITPMCMELTYNGLIDEYIGIKNGGFGLGDSTSIDMSQRI